MSSLGRYSADPSEWNIWLEQPRPRLVRMQRRQRFWVALIFASMSVIATALFAILFTEWQAHPLKKTMHSDIWSAIPFIAGALLFMLMLYMFNRRDRRLVSEGEVTIGKVVAVGTRRKYRTVTYEFLDRSGRLITASCPDNTRSFTEGMAIPVFFNSENPESDQIALCGTPYEVAIERPLRQL